MTSIDPRLVDRRKEVAEDRARRNIRRLLRLLVALGVMAAVVWLFLSPTLSAATVEVIGVDSSGAVEVLEEKLVVPGRPLILVRAGDVEEALLSDPWVRTADVNLDWPNRIVITVEERTPVAWVETAGGWARRAIDGVELPGVDGPDESLARIVLDGVPDDQVRESAEVLGALEFLAAFPSPADVGMIIDDRSGELWATLPQFEVRLGRPTEMSAKALTLAALLREDLAAGSQINLIAPTNPAVIPPGQEPAGG